MTPSSGSFYEIDVSRFSGDATPRVGDRLPLALKAVDEPGLRLEAPLIDLPSDRSAIPILIRKTSDGVEAVPLSVGQVTIPSLPVKNADGKVVGQTRPFAITIAGPKNEDTKTDAGSQTEAGQKRASAELQLFPPEELSYPPQVIYGAAGAILLLLAVVIVFALRRSRRSLQGPRVSSLSEHAEAFELFTKLDRDETWKKDPKRFCFAVSEGLKRYYSRRYKVDALESTTREMLGLLEGAGVSSDLLARNRELFDRLDLVKFTDQRLDEQEFPRLLSSAKDLVTASKRTEMQGATHAVR